jgi:hypothetical protein
VAIEMLMETTSLYERMRPKVDRGKTPEERERAVTACANAFHAATEQVRKLRAMFPHDSRRVGVDATLDETLHLALDELERRWREYAQDFESIRSRAAQKRTGED